MISIQGGGITELLARIQAVRDTIMPTLEQSMSLLGDEVVAQLSEASPRGQYEGQPPPGDAPGRLANSFTAFVEAAESEVVLTVETSQPTKLRFITQGRGAVYPVTKQALFWEGLDHPVKYAGPTTANDFVSPITEAWNQEAPQWMEAATQGLIGMV